MVVVGVLSILVVCVHLNAFNPSAFASRRCVMLSSSVTQDHLQTQLIRSYSGDSIYQYYNSRPVQVLKRFTEVGSPILSWWIKTQVDKASEGYRTEATKQTLAKSRAEELKNAIVEGGSVAFIKGGQALALRSDVLQSREYVEQLQLLQDEVGTFPDEVAMRIISEELGNDAHALFEFEPAHPIASASIGQVYKATLRATGQKVAVKVQRPTAIEQVPVDIHILRLGAQYLKKRYKLRSDLVGIVDEFGAQLFQEMNYIQEGQNCQRFKALYGSIPGIFVPEVLTNLTTRRVLTMEFVEGTKGPWANGGERMLTVGLQCSVLQLLGTGFFHADPHRGNLLQTPEGNLAYLDFGMMSEVSASKRYAMIGSVLGLVNRDLDMTISSMNELEFFTPGTDTDLVVSSLRAALENSTDNTGGAALNFTKLNENLGRISDKLPFRLPPYYTMVIRSLTILEGLALFVDPNFRLIRGAYPFVARQILTEPSPELTKLLQRVLVTSDGHINWAQLRSFVSISAKADAAVQGNFAALQSAQSQSDLLRIYNADTSTAKGYAAQRAQPSLAAVNASAEPAEEALNAEVALLMLDFLLSPSGTFLRQPLVSDLADLLEQLGLTAQSLLALSTNDLVPSPLARPSRTVVTGFLNSLSSIADASRSRDIALGSTWLKQTAKFLARTLLRPTDTAKASQLVSRVNQLVQQIAVTMVQRQVRSVSRALLSPARVARVMPGIAGVLDLVRK